MKALMTEVSKVVGSQLVGRHPAQNSAKTSESGHVPAVLIMSNRLEIWGKMRAVWEIWSLLQKGLLLKALD